MYIIYKAPSCIDLIFVNQPNLVVESGVSPSLCKECHHQIIHATFSFQIFLPQAYEREVWHYKRVRVDLIKRAIDFFDWKNSFRDTSVNDQVELLNDVLLNIFRNFIPHETMKCSYKDPPWMSTQIKKLLRKKNRVHKKYVTNGKRQEDHEILRQLTDSVNDLITKTKARYFSNLGEKLNNPLTGPKTYWSILRRFMNNVKVPSIPPLLVDGTFETDFEKKAGIFNAFFSKQCNIITALYHHSDIRLRNA